MKLVKYNEGRLGALVDDNVIDLNYAFAAYKKSKGVSNPQRKAGEGTEGHRPRRGWGVLRPQGRETCLQERRVQAQGTAAK